MTKIIFATGNENKMKEIRQIMSDMNVEILSMNPPDRTPRRWDCRRSGIGL